ncbi:biotin-dependent carboxyltransferase family protein [Psychroflexus salis]|uniref:KipI antagonist n=1 Tax=Psychroflexus salis TaxID=1526574 RepID=A0A917A093_9FLAO|nr:biotin-dependent carboxyltransferase family protein [Psychroflexus salis]GGE19722.1 KipI antagonist [Psychroflexus salis]
MIKVLHPGLHTTFQDIGRFGVAQYAIPQSGVMDEYAAKLANLLLQNKANYPVLEISLFGPKLLFEKETELVCTGLKAKIQLNSVEVPINEVLAVKKGDVLHIQQVSEGNYVYLACNGGFISDVVFNSRSFYEGITPQEKVEKQDELAMSNSYQLARASTEKHAQLKFQKEQYKNDILEVFEGPEFHCLSQVQQDKLLNAKFHLSKNYNRMAFQIEEIFSNQLESIITSPVIPGTVQLTPDGKLIVLMKDAQITGGYPRVLQLGRKAISLLAQKRQNEAIQFQKLKI